MSEINGLLLVDKPVGITSHDVVARVRKAFNMKSVGHTGTLDPMASGLMVLLLGEGTKVSDFLLRGDKGYKLKAKLGVVTDTLDITGEVKKETPVDLNLPVISEMIGDLQGEIELPIPMFSAKKIKGKKLYEYARAGEEIEIPKKIMKFYDFKDIEVGPAEVALEFRCSKGSFVRSWTSELGQRLKVGAALTELRRTFSAPYSLGKAVALEELQEKLMPYQNQEASEKLALVANPLTENTCKELFAEAFLPLASALPNLPAFTITGKDERLMFNGNIPLDLKRRMIQVQKRVNRSGDIEMVKVLSGSTGRLQAILEVTPCKSLRIRRNFR